MGVFSSVQMLPHQMNWAVPQLPQALAAPSPADAKGGMLGGVLPGGQGTAGQGGAPAPAGGAGAPGGVDPLAALPEGAAGAGAGAASQGGIMDMIMKLLASGAVPV